jgi:hypothetical protein
MSSTYTNAALEAELAYRREILTAAGRRTRGSRGRWLPNRRRHQI